MQPGGSATFQGPETSPDAALKGGWLGPPWAMAGSNEDSFRRKRCQNVSNPLFHVHCTTCGARLKVTDRRAVGAILACPKCQCMVEVVPPPGFVLEDRTEPSPAPTTPSQAGTTLQQRSVSGPLAEGGQRREDDVISPASTVPVPLAEETAPKKDPSWSGVAQGAPPSPNEVAPQRSVEAPPVATGSATLAAAEEDSEQDWESELGKAGATWLSPAESKVRRILLIIAGSIAAAAILASLWIFRSTTTKREIPGTTGEQTVTQSPSQPPGTVDPQLAEASTSPGGPPTAVAPDDTLTSWLPRDAVFVIGGGDQFRRSLAQTAWLFAPLLPYNADAVVNEAMKSLGILPQAVARFTLGVGPAGQPQTIVLFELREDQSTASLESLGRPADVAIRDRKTIVLQGNGKNLLIIVIDSKTVAVGDADYLRSGIAALDGPASENGGLINDLGKERRHWFAGIDLEHWRSKEPRFPNWVFDRLPEVMPHWRRLLDSASAFSLDMLNTEQGPCLACRWSYRNDGDKDAGLESLNALTAAARQWVGQRTEAVHLAIQSGSLTADQARPVEVFLSSLLSLLDRATLEKSNDGVMLTILLEKGEDWIAAATDARALLDSDWLQLGVAMWRLRGETLGTGLQGIVETEGLFPAPAAGGSLLPPETRLSWLASTLPYFGYDDWYSRLNPGYGWRAPQNRSITARELREVINPLLGPTQTREGFFDSHWVGVAGFGEGAAELAPNDPRAGLFNYNGRRGLQNLERGAANTLAVLGASARLGAWAEGGFATARPLTRQPYVNGPDGFGSGLPHGMLGMMADGSVRFIHRDVAPEVLERLAVVRGNGSATVADLLSSGTASAAEFGGWSTAPSGTDPGSPPSPEGGQVEGPAPVETPLFPTEQALATRLARVTMQEVPLGLVLHLIAQWSSIPVSVQPEALCAEDVSLRSPVSLSAENATLREIVQQVAEQTGLEVRIEPSGVVTLTSIHADLPETRVYRAVDYGGCFPFDENLAQLVRGVFAPSPEIDAASDFEVVTVPEGLRIKCPPCTHRQIETLLLRQLCRGEAPANGRPRDWPSPKAGDSPVSATFLQVTPLSEVILALDQACEIDIVVDWSNLVRAAITPQTPVTLTADDAPIGQVLRDLGGKVPLGILESEDVVILTTLEAADQPAVRVYGIGSLLDSGTNVGRLREQIISHCSPNSWIDNGGKGVLIPFPAAKCLVAHNAPAICACVEEFLSSYENGTSPPNN